MKAVLVYDSVFGNTGQIVTAIEEGLKQAADTELLSVKQASAEDLMDADLLVVGSPTRGFRPTPEITTLLITIPPHSLTGMKVAAFDTRFDADEVESRFLGFVVRTGGYAAKHIAGQLQAAGGELIAAPEGFYVTDVQGPLAEGELERARLWAQTLLEKCQAPVEQEAA